jgi:uncharacterized protein DUF1707
MTADWSSLRASDEDREDVAVALRAHCAAGRLEVGELEERLAATLSARTLGELERLVADLPGGRSPVRTRRSDPAPASSPAKRQWPGLLRFHQRHLFDRDRKLVFRQAVTHLVPAMVDAGYDVVSRSEPELLVLEREERPSWVPLVCIFLFPFGLLALTVRDKHRVVISLDELQPHGTQFVVQGTATRAVRKAFANLSVNESWARRRLSDHP